MKVFKIKNIFIIGSATVIILAAVFLAHGVNRESNKVIYTSGEIANIEGLSNTKIGWGIKRNDNHQQPDLGSKNKELMEKYNGLCMGSNENPYIYLTFDLGYEAGYTEKILEVLKQNDVKAVFFITAHYLNTQPELVKRMIDDGHIVGNHIPNTLMYHI